MGAWSKEAREHFRRERRRRAAARGLFEAFWSFVDRQEGCWTWTASVGDHGYGQLTHLQQKYTAHRLAWELYRGAVPDGLCVLHRCDNRRCVNPDHLFLGTRKDNLEDMTQKGRRVRGVTHGRAKLTVDQVLAIRSSATSARSEARIYGVSDSLVRLIRKGKRWTHV
jgi:hypothetical protein